MSSLAREKAKLIVYRDEEHWHMGDNLLDREALVQLIVSAIQESMDEVTADWERSLKC